MSQGRWLPSYWRHKYESLHTMYSGMFIGTSIKDPHSKSYSDVIMSVMASQTTGISIVYSAVCLGVDQGKNQSSASRAFVRWIHWWPVNSMHKGPVTRTMLPFDDVIMNLLTRWCITRRAFVLSFFRYIFFELLKYCSSFKKTKYVIWCVFLRLTYSFDEFHRE